MRQGRTGYAIANGVVARDVGRVVIVHHDSAVINDDSDVFKPMFDVGYHTCGAQYDVTCDDFLALLGLDFDHLFFAFGLDAKTSDEVMTLMPDFLKLFSVVLIAVLDRNDSVLVLNYCHFGAMAL